jgi:Tfp pilus assembly protein PilW
VDVLAALALLATMSLAVLLAFRANLATWLTVQQYAAEQQNGRIAVNQVARSVRMLGTTTPPRPPARPSSMPTHTKSTSSPTWTTPARPSATAFT